LIVLVGLPARGKSFIARKLLNYLTWRGNKCQIFNVGKYRRQAAAELRHEEHDHHADASGKRQKVGACDADFFDDSNEAASKLRQRAAEVALRDTLEWLEDNGSNGDSSLSSLISDESLSSLDSFTSGHTSHSARRQTQRIAIFDATNSTRERRRWILQECAKASEASGKRTGVVFVESICDDKELLAENFNVKISSCPDFEDVSEKGDLFV
jgi:predicted kinase